MLHGVGHARIASVSVVPECRPLSVEYAAAPEDALSFAVAVGQHEESLPSVRRPDFGCGEHTPFRIEPELGKVAKDLGEPKRKMPADVFEEDEHGSALVNDSSDLGPEVSLVGFGALLAGDGEWLTRVARSDKIHSATPWSAAEGSEIVGDRSTIQGRVFHPCHEDGRREGVALDVTNGPRSSGQSQAEVNAPNPGA